MAFPTTSLLDNFNRADGALGAPNWTQGVYAAGDSNLAISSQVVQSDGAGARVNAHAYWSSTTFGPDSEAYVDVPTVGTQVISLFARITTPGAGTANGYAWRRDIAGAAHEIDRFDNGSPFTLGATFAGTVAAGDTFGLEVIGNTISLYRKPSGGAWGLVASRTDSTYSAAGKIGAEVWAGSQLDNFSGGTVVTAAPVVPQLPLPLLMRLRPFLGGIGLPVRVSPIAPPVVAAPLQVTGAGTIPTGEAFGTTVVQRQVREDGTGIASSVAFGTATVQRRLGNAGQVASGQAFGVTKLFMQLGPAGIQSAAAFGVTRLNRLLGTLGIATAEQFGTTQVQRLIGNVGQIASQVALGVARLIRVTVAGQISSGEQFGTEKALRQVREDGTGIGSGAAFGTATIGTPLSPSVSGVGAIPTGQQFGTTKILRQVREDGTGIPTAAAEGQPAVGRLIGPAGIPSGAAVGQPAVARRVGPSGISSGEAFGQAAVGRRVGTTGIGTAQAFGTQTVGRRVGAAGISTGEQFGTAKLGRQVGPTGIASQEALGTPRTIRVTQLGAIQSATAFGTTVIGHPTLPPPATLQPGLYASARQPRLRISTTSPVIEVAEVSVGRVRVATGAPTVEADTVAAAIASSDASL